MDRESVDLRRSLRKLRCRNAWGLYFIPEKRLRETITSKTVQESMLTAGIPPHKVEELAKNVLQQGVKIFCILVLIDQVPAIMKFVELYEFEDRRLPLDKRVLKDVLAPDAIEDFEERQRELLAPTFSRGTIHKFLDKDVVLPFVKDEEIGKGAFGVVSEIALMPDHQDLEDVFQRRVRVHEIS